MQVHRRCTPLGHSNRLGTGAPKGNFIFPPVHLKFLFEALAALLVCDQAAHLFEVARMVFRTKSGLRPALRLRRLAMRALSRTPHVASLHCDGEIPAQNEQRITRILRIYVRAVSREILLIRVIRGIRCLIMTQRRNLHLKL